MKNLTIPADLHVFNSEQGRYYIKLYLTSHITDANYVKPFCSDLGQVHRGKTFYTCLIYDMRTKKFVDDVKFVNCFGKKYNKQVNIHPIAKKAMFTNGEKFIKTNMICTL